MEGKQIKVNTRKPKILIFTYYWPPSGGSGVQRWMYFAKYLKQLHYEPIIITVNESQASYPILDKSLAKEVEGIKVIKTMTREPLSFYSRLTSGNAKKGIPQGEVKTKNIFDKIAAYIRGNFFIPDARKGWVPYAIKAAKKVLEEEKINFLITTGPPHSSHLIGLELKKQFDLNWWADFRDPWTNIFYNSSLYRSSKTIAKDYALEKEVLQKSNGVITTVAGELLNQLKTKAPNQTFINLPNGYDADIMQNTNAAQRKNNFHIVYTGLLTKNQAYTELLKEIHKLSKTNSIYFSLAGKISNSTIIEIKRSLPIVEVEYLGYLSHQNAIALMKSADLLLNFIFKGAETQMISGKLLEYMATEVPILSIGDPNSQAAQFLRLGSHAWMVHEQDKSKIKYYLKSLLEQKTKPKNKTLQLEDWSRKELTLRLVGEVLSL